MKIMMDFFDQVLFNPDVFDVTGDIVDRYIFCGYDSHGFPPITGSKRLCGYSFCIQAPPVSKPGLYRKEGEGGAVKKGTDDR